MRHDELKFPCLSISKNGIYTMVWKTIVTTALALKKGVYKDRRIVDSTGSEYSVLSAVKLRGYGPFGGWNLFFNQTIVVELNVEPTGKVYAVDEFRKLVLKDFKSWHGWESRIGIEELKYEVKHATTCAEILRAMTKHEPPEPPEVR